MASNVLRLVFRGAGDKKITFNFNNAKASPIEADVRALAVAIVSNSDIFEEKPLEALGAEVIVTSAAAINLG